MIHQKNLKTVEDYINSIDSKWTKLFNLIHTTIKNNIPKEFEETISYNMIGFVVPFSIYPLGYHVNPELPLPFINLGVQKNYISIYHLGLYNNKEILEWFIQSHIKEKGKKPDMGKSCIRYKNINSFPVKTFTQLLKKISVESYIKDIDILKIIYNNSYQ